MSPGFGWEGVGGEAGLGRQTSMESWLRGFLLQQFRSKPVHVHPDTCGTSMHPSLSPVDPVGLRMRRERRSDRSGRTPVGVLWLLFYCRVSTGA